MSKIRGEASLPWSDEDAKTLKELHEAGWTAQQLADHFGRTLQGVRTKLTRVFMTPAQLVRMREREKSRSACRIRRPRGKNAFSLDERMTVPDQVWVERDARNSAARDLTGMMFGDPPKGYSALDRRA